MDVNIYSVERTYVVPETQAALNALLSLKIALREWSEETLFDLQMTRSERIEIKKRVRLETDGEEWDLGTCHVDMTHKIRLPILCQTYLDYIETDQSDLLTLPPVWHVMTPKMIDPILSSGVNVVSYPVAVFDRKLILGMEENELETFADEFDRGAHVRYQMLHLLDSMDVFDPERSDDSEKTYVLANPSATLPPFFRVSWGPITSLLATEEGKTRLEAVKLLGVKFEPLQIIG
ncbi:hypothetical protein [Deinococcus knuensis]|uniref:Uncharacterized protein n=1 Tax=Deinococcus knuensis TaxID=1837380 RepID=A0ABQ2SQD5_9DEIO|nr:hypothetical protein [Deinococcus knuensis]GGS36518.1 hypothetical protein GCM10008961_30240 [Deinococcus knuensis]